MEPAVERLAQRVLELVREKNAASRRAVLRSEPKRDSNFLAWLSVAPFLVESFSDIIFGDVNGFDARQQKRILSKNLLRELLQGII